MVKGSKLKKADLTKRVEVLQASLLFEAMVGYCLAFMLNMKPDNRSFGVGNDSLSFNAKALLLMDMSVITKGEKLKLEYFMNIRNKFMHVFIASSYTKCIQMVSGLENGLKKFYPFDGKKSLEDNLEVAVKSLMEDCTGIVQTIFNATMDQRIKEKTNAEAVKELLALKTTFGLMKHNAKKSKTPDVISLKTFEKFYDLMLDALNKNEEAIRKSVSEKKPDIL
jgi:hypothetical protein